MLTLLWHVNVPKLARISTSDTPKHCRTIMMSEIAQISIKATTTEKRWVLTGLWEGASCTATVLISHAK